MFCLSLRLSFKACSVGRLRAAETSEGIEVGRETAELDFHRQMLPNGGNQPGKIHAFMNAFSVPDIRIEQFLVILQFFHADDGAMDLVRAVGAEQLAQRRMLNNFLAGLDLLEQRRWFGTVEGNEG